MLLTGAITSTEVSRVEAALNDPVFVQRSTLNTLGTVDVLHKTVNSKNVEVLDLLLKWRNPYTGKFFDPRYFPALHTPDSSALLLAVRSNQMAMVDVILKWRGPRDEYVNASLLQYYILRDTKTREFVDMLRLVLSWEGKNRERINVGYDGEYAVYNAARYGDIENLRVLLEWRDSKGQGAPLDLETYVSPGILGSIPKSALEAIAEEIIARREWTSIRVAWIGTVVRGLQMPK